MTIGIQARNTPKTRLFYSGASEPGVPGLGALITVESVGSWPGVTVTVVEHCARSPDVPRVYSQVEGFTPAPHGASAVF